jgi:hypothetical protein
MPSPFPGMDPYLEGYLWPDVHHRLASGIAERIAPAIAPQYVARIALYTVEDTTPEGDEGIMYPDVEVLLRKNSAEEPAQPDVIFTPVSARIPHLSPVSVNIPFVEIRDRESNRLITAIEILSPVNKRTPGLAPYREKRRRLHQSGVHLLEIDLLRRGQRPIEHPRLSEYHYVVTLLRAGIPETDIWGFNLADPMPVVPVPLATPDPDFPLDLHDILQSAYERGLYHLSIDYSQAPPPPPFSDAESAWMKALLPSQ